MDNWSLKNNNNNQLLLNNNSQAASFNESLDQDEDLVEKLFRESLQELQSNTMILSPAINILNNPMTDQYQNNSSIPPKPQLRLHLKKVIDLPVDPIKPHLDIINLRRLTIATLRTLGVYLSFDDLPIIDTKQPPIDSHQIPPAAAMQLMTSMILGASGTNDSQISNGDLIVLQRLIVAGLHSKNFAVPTIEGPRKRPKQKIAYDKNIIDLLHVCYDPPQNMTRLFLRLYRFIINRLLSTPDCWPFIQPVPKTAYVYHQEIKNPMDFLTIEENVWNGKYTKFASFEKDIQLIWKNARAFHHNTGTIPKHADNLEKLYDKIMIDIKRQVVTQEIVFDPSITLPEEESMSSSIDQRKQLYTISAMSPYEPKKKSLSDEKLLYLQLNGPFFEAIEKMKSDPDSHYRLPRFYIAKNRTLLRQVRLNGILAIFYNIKKSNKKFEADIILTYPASDLFMIEQTDDAAPKAWIHLLPICILQSMSFESNEIIDREYFKKLYTTCKIDSKHDPTTNTLLKNMTDKILDSILPPQPQPLQPLPLNNVNMKEMDHQVWKKLFNVCQAKDIVLKDVSTCNITHWNTHNSEGFFKRVYFFDDLVIQIFREMSMYQRVTEIVCLMKLKKLPHMAQIKEIIYDCQGDIVGLSMEKYQITLKQYIHVHSHHRLTAYQKYDVIYQMLKCMKIIHEAGLAHRDLSEVNIMLNVLDGQYLEDGNKKVCLYFIDFGKAVFCKSEDVRDWVIDIPHDEEDVVPTKEDLDSWCESLPWVKAKPDHGYRMYRSIQTLPKTRLDNQVLPWLIDPQAEDIYSIGVMIWKVFTDTEPWRGILDTDLQGLRYVAEDDYRLQRAIESEVHGEISRQLLLKCLKTNSQDRSTAIQLLEWIEQDDIKQGLINEWKMYSSDTRSTRRAKTFQDYELSTGIEKKKPRKKK